MFRWKDKLVPGSEIVKEVVGFGLDDVKSIQERYRSIEIVITNKTKENLVFDSHYFDSGTFVHHPMPDIAEPGKSMVALVSNKEGSVLTGVTGSFKLNIKDAFLHIGFCNPAVGTYKTFIGMSKIFAQEPVEWGYENCENDDAKTVVAEGYKLTARLEHPLMAQTLFCYAIDYDD